MKHISNYIGRGFLSLLLYFSIISSSLAANPFESEFQAFKDKIYSSKKAESNPEQGYALNPLNPLNQRATNKRPPATYNARKVAGENNPLNRGASGSLKHPPLLGVPLSKEQRKLKMEANVAKQKARIEIETFNAALKSILPLKPEQIKALLETFKQNRRAAETPIAFPKPKIQVQTVSLDPSMDPPLVKTSPGYVTTIEFLDSTGSPWAIQDIGWAGKFEVTGPEEGGHVIRVVPQTAHGIGNLSIRLVDLITPVTLSLRSGLDEVYYRFDARIPKLGPLAKAPLIEYGGLSASVGEDQNLVSFLDGTPPSKSERLKVDGVDSRTKVWKANGNIYLRTPFTLLSPSWKSSVRSADGMNVYTLSGASVILLSDNGRMVKARIFSDGAP